MPVPATATPAEFAAASYMVEAVYRVVPGTGTVFYAVTTGDSNREGGYPELWDVYHFPAECLVDVLPFRYISDWRHVEYKGRLGVVSPETKDRMRYPTMQSYCEASRLVGWYRHWIGFSQPYHTLDGRYHCLDVYWQTPHMLYGSVWIWYVMLDAIEPTEYWRGRIMYFNGTRNLGLETVRSRV